MRHDERTAAPPGRRRQVERNSAAATAAQQTLNPKSRVALRGDGKPDVSAVMTYFANFQRRVIQDAVNESTATYWRRRADAFRAALPRQEEWHGHEGLPAVRRRRDNLLEVIKACEFAAQVAMFEDHHELRLSDSAGGDGRD